MRIVSAFAFMASLLLVGCQNPVPTPSDLSENDPETVPFTGDVRPELVGTWKAEVGITLMLDAKGGLIVISQVRARGNQTSTEQIGEWRATDKKLLFRIGGDVSEYRYRRENQALSLTSKRDAKPTIYRQQAKETAP